MISKPHDGDFSTLQMQNINHYWYQLVREDGNPMGSADKVKLSAGSDIADLRKAVKAENADGLLKGISPAQLTVYGNKAAFNESQSLEVDSQLTGLGASMKVALLVCVVIPTMEGIELLLSFSACRAR